MSKKIAFRAVGPVSDETLAAHRRHARGLGLPEVGQSEPKRIPLAVVGGDHTISEFVDELKAFPGEIWAINGTWQWLKDRGIDAVFYAIDPHPTMIAEYGRGAAKAVLADTCHPSAFASCDGIALARTGIDAIAHDTSAASTAPMIAAAAGYSHLTVYGCGGSFPDGGATHAYKDVPCSRMWVDCGGREYVTEPGLVMQTEFLAGLARALPHWITVRGEGFLAALVGSKDYDVTHVTRNLDDAWREVCA